MVNIWFGTVIFSISVQPWNELLLYITLNVDGKYTSFNDVHWLNAYVPTVVYPSGTTIVLTLFGKVLGEFLLNAWFAIPITLFPAVSFKGNLISSGFVPS